MVIEEMVVFEDVSRVNSGRYLVAFIAENGRIIMLEDFLIEHLSRGDNYEMAVTEIESLRTDGAIADRHVSIESYRCHPIDSSILHVGDRFVFDQR